MRQGRRASYGRDMSDSNPNGPMTTTAQVTAQHGKHADDTERVDQFRSAQQRVLDRYHVTARSQMIHIPQLGTDVHALVSGEGPPVLMVIGGGMVAALWSPLIAQLGGVTTIAFDPPGHGLSEPVPYSTSTLRATAVGLIEGVLDSFSIASAPIVAQSMGGLWSMWYTLDRPQRVSAISLVGCPALMLGTSAPLPLRLATIRPLHRLIDRLQPPSPRQVERLGKMAGEPLGDLPELRDMFLAYERLPAASTELLDLHRAAIRVRGARPEVALTADHLRELTRPVQFVWGEHDPFGPPDVGRRAAELVADAEFHSVDAGHGPWFTRPTEVGDLVSAFLARHR